MPACLLCLSESSASYFEDKLHSFFKCSNCGTVFRDPSNFVSPSEEKERYLTHNNDVNDPGYQEFVSPITEAVINHYTTDATGLDYGAGTGPVIAKILGDRGFSIQLYDPFFHPEKEVLEQAYDFVVCCEVIEHFHRPLEEFCQLHGLLKTRGKLLCMTDPLTEENFEKWYYKNDPTHVIFYNDENLQWIVENSEFSEVSREGRFVEFIA